jgi:hypothetical protein|tara:strand:+ start:552 stop:1004 length:453 start_codon:yes stop_codon:yes gene_type:complete
MSYQSLKYNITANKGIDFTLYLRYLDENDSVVDLVGGGYTAEMQVRRFAESDTKLLQFISTNGGASVFGPSGVTAGLSGGSGGIRLNSTFTGGINDGMSGSTGGIYIFADASTMTNVPTGRHFYEVDIIQGSNILRLIEGRFEVIGNINR